MVSKFMTIGILATAIAGKPCTYVNATANTYDYIIVGGGLTGLVAASRLSENSNVSVLVVEYGDFDRSNTTQIPYYATTFNTPSMRAVETAPELYAGNNSFTIYVGAVPGGGSQVNGMAWDYPSKADIDSWEALGNPGWGWDDLQPYLRKSNNYTAPDVETVALYGYSDEVSEESGLSTNGPAQASYPKFQYPDMYTVKKGLDELGIPFIADPSTGESVGQYWIQSAINPHNETRSSSLYAYYDTVSNRPNLKLLPLHQATEILFSSNTSELVATGVKVLDRSSNNTVEFKASKEVVLAAGSLWTPQLLQWSGIGPKSVLEAAGIDVKLDAPAVGSNFQDHPTMYLVWNVNATFPTSAELTTNITYWDEAVNLYVNENTGPLTKAQGSYLGMLDLSTVAGTEEAASIIQALKNQTAGEYLPDFYATSPELLAGFEAQRAIMTRDIQSGASAVLEVPVGGGGVVPNALEKPFSRGSVHLNPSDPYGLPVLTYNVLQNPFDRTMMKVFVGFTRRLWNTTAVASLAPVELVPGPTAETVDEILAAVLAAPGSTFSPSFAHPSCTCPMMPRELGGVVSSDLLVYGTKRLSIIDSSILPIIPACHLQATMYGVAEKASDIIKGRA